MKYTALFTTLLVVFATSLATTATQAQSVTLDGFYDASNTNEVNAYSNTESVDWTNGHNTTDDYWYDGLGASTIQATIRHGSGTLAGDTSGNTYFFLYVEAPLEIKGMSWSKDTNDLADYYQYVLGGQHLHQEDLYSNKPHITKMEFSTATGSEKVEFSSNGNYYLGDFEEATGLSDGEGPGLIGLADSIDYLLANPSLLQDQNGESFDVGIDQLKNSTSINPDIAMAFEFQFGTQQQLDNAVAAARTGIVLHMSPTKVPEPSSTLLLGLASIGMILRRKRQ